jgi:hypothetical protein
MPVFGTSLDALMMSALRGKADLEPGRAEVSYWTQTGL